MVKFGIRKELVLRSKSRFEGDPSIGFFTRVGTHSNSAQNFIMSEFRVRRFFLGSAEEKGNGHTGVG